MSFNISSITHSTWDTVKGSLFGDAALTDQLGELIVSGAKYVLPVLVLEIKGGIAGADSYAEDRVHTDFPGSTLECMIQEESLVACGTSMFDLVSTIAAGKIKAFGKQYDIVSGTLILDILMYIEGQG